MKRYLTTVLAAGIAATGLIAGGVFFAEAQSYGGPVTCTLAASPTSITQGDSAMLSWTSENATSVTFDNNLGSPDSASSGSITVTPAALPTTYGATFTGPSGTASCYATVGATSGSTSTASVPSNDQSTSPVTTSPAPTVITIPTPAPVTTVTTTIAPTPVPAPAAVDVAGPQPTVLTVDTNGNAVIRGVVGSVSASSFTLRTWGGIWTITPVAGATIVPLGTLGGIDLSGIQPGDFVGADGTVSQSQNWTIVAGDVHDWTKSPPAAAPMISASAPAPAAGTTTTTTTTTTGDTLYTGTASNIGANAFTLTDASGTTYTVNLNTGASIWNTGGGDIPLSDFQSGDTVRVDGILQSDGSISADVVRDTAQ